MLAHIQCSANTHSIPMSHVSLFWCKENCNDSPFWKILASSPHPIPIHSSWFTSLFSLYLLANFPLRIIIDSLATQVPFDICLIVCISKPLEGLVALKPRSLDAGASHRLWQLGAPAWSELIRTSPARANLIPSNPVRLFPAWWFVLVHHISDDKQKSQSSLLKESKRTMEHCQIQIPCKHEQTLYWKKRGKH